MIIYVNRADVIIPIFITQHSSYSKLLCGNYNNDYEHPLRNHCNSGCYINPYILPVMIYQQKTERKVTKNSYIWWKLVTEHAKAMNCGYLLAPKHNNKRLAIHADRIKIAKVESWLPLNSIFYLTKYMDDVKLMQQFHSRKLFFPIGLTRNYWYWQPKTATCTLSLKHIYIL